MERHNQCHKCKKTIRGKMVYCGGWVWHRKCTPSNINLKGRRR